MFEMDMMDVIMKAGVITLIFIVIYFSIIAILYIVYDRVSNKTFVSRSNVTRHITLNELYAMYATSPEKWVVVINEHGFSNGVVAYFPDGFLFEFRPKVEDILERSLKKCVEYESDFSEEVYLFKLNLAETLSLNVELARLIKNQRLERLQH